MSSVLALERSSRLPKLAGANVDFEGHVTAMTFSSDRFGLLACADPGAALRALGGVSRNNAEAVELIGFAVGEAHLAARVKAKVAVQ